MICLDHRQIVNQLTRDIAFNVIGNKCKDIEIVYRNDMKGFHAMCYPLFPRIEYNEDFIRKNINNELAIKWVIVEECAHLLHLYHNEEFYNLCIKLGYDVRNIPEYIEIE